MNSLKLKLNPYTDVSIASMDDKPLSPYSELNNYMKEPFLKWADKILEATEREINDDFDLMVVAEDFESLFLNDMQSDFDACKTYITEKFRLNYSVSQRYDMLIQLAMNYGVSIDSASFRMPFYSDVVVEHNNELLIDSEPERANLLITDSMERAKNLLGGNQLRLVVLISDKPHVTCAGNMKFIWEIEASRATKVVNLISERFVKVPLIVELARQLENKKQTMSEEDKEKLTIATEIDMFIMVEDIEDIEVGNSYKPKFRILPESEMFPLLRITSSNPNVIAAENDLLVAHTVGQAVIEFYKADELMPFAKKEVKAFHDNFVQKIELSVCEKKMGIGKKQQINIALIPEDADDAKQVKWSIDNENIAEVDNSGVISTKTNGRAIISAETVRAKKSIEIEVLPNLSNIVLNEDVVELYVGQSEPIKANVEPANAFNSDCEWKTSDKSVAIVTKLDDGAEVIQAVGIGECNITCVAKEGECNATCKVLVESTFKKRENIHTMLSITALCMVVSLFCAALSFKPGCILAAVATTVCGIMAIIKNKSDRSWAVILIAISAVAIFW